MTKKKISSGQKKSKLSKQTVKFRVSPEFQRWLNRMKKQYGPALAELAKH